MQEGLILCRFVHFGAVLLLFGMQVCRSLLFKHSLQAVEADQTRACADRGRSWLSAIALISAVVWLLLTAASMAGDWRDALDAQTLLLVLGNTFFGHVWMLHLGLAVVGLLAATRLLRLPRTAGLVIYGLLLMTLAPIGHGAMFDGLYGQLLILNQMLHLTAVSIWLGGLVMLAQVLARPEGVNLTQLLLRFSGIGYGLVAVIIVTGLVNVRALSGALWPQPAFSGFGLVLAIKVLLVLCMLALAAFNRSKARQAPQRVTALRISVTLECLFGAFALAAVSLLGTLPPMLT